MSHLFSVTNYNLFHQKKIFFSHHNGNQSSLVFFGLIAPVVVAPARQTRHWLLTRDHGKQRQATTATSLTATISHNRQETSDDSDSP
jgi:hypothetical protein